MQKPIILFLFAVAVYISLTTQNEKGIPKPQAIAPAVWLYGTLMLVSDFLGGAPVAIGAGLTVALYWRAQSQKKISAKANKPKTTDPYLSPKPPASGLTGPQGG